VHVHAAAGMAVAIRISYQDHGFQPNSLVKTETLLTCTGQSTGPNASRDTDCSDWVLLIHPKQIQI